MGKIVLLDELTINQIAAGEVIERPASVVKEMVENSIDAGATNIVVEIRNGGISFIRVSDNGKGIAQDDLEIAFERHATSKIRSAADLDTVTSMGFRGEALASIAAVANVELVSKTQEQEIGYRVVVEAGDILEKEEMGCRTGTTITVKNLFFNTPVRYKFLKKDYTESGYIEYVITRLALVNHNVAIKLINTGKTVIQTNGSGKLKDVVYSIYGKDIANGIMEVNYDFEDIKINGVIGKPEIARSNRSNQLFFVNKRYIKDKTLTAATEQAYKGLIPIGRFGFVILNLTMNPAKVDVNVHPAKLEVRFQEENKVFQSIYHAIKDVLLKAELVKDPAKVNEENANRIDRSAISFEERLRNLREAKKENSNNGLFGFRKQHEKEIEEYNEQESKIKTNSVQDNMNVGQGGPINTADILEQLKKMKEDLQKQIDNKEENDKTKIEGVLPESEEKKEEQTTENSEIKNQDLEQEESIKTENEEIAQEKNTETKIEKNIQEENTETKIEENIQEENIETKIEEINEQIEKMEGRDYTETPAEDFNTMYEKLFGRKPIETPIVEDKKDTNTAIDLIKENISVFEESAEYQRPTYKFIGIAFNTYIIIEMDKEMYIIDQHAAHERIMYEKVKRNYYNDTSKDSQLLLLPDIITLSHKEMEIAKDNMEMFEKAGFTLEEFGENTIKLTGVPTVCIDIDNKELFLETLDEINTVARTAKQEKEEKFIATVACKAAVKANMVLDKAEVENLMDKLLELPNPFTCPHGRPTAIKMSKYDIERKFARK